METKKELYGRGPGMLALDDIKKFNSLPPEERSKAAADFCEWLLEGYKIAPEWQPIETAPKDLEDGLLICTKLGDRDIGFWDERCRCWAMGYETQTYYGHRIPIKFTDPMYWQLIPEPPKGNKDA